MKFFKNTSIKEKQRLIVMAICAVALLTASLAFAIYEIITFKITLEQNLSTLAEIVGSNTSAAIDFGDEKSATETLSALSAEPNIEAACIYTTKGDVFAVYRNKEMASFTPLPWQAQGTYFDRGFRLFRPIERKGEVVGTVYVQSNFNALYSRISGYILIAVLVFVVSALLAFILAEYLQSIISGPILSLVSTARKVTAERDYGVRAAKQNEDELGVLIDVFNDMLQQIQERDSALKTAQVELENRVIERTTELADSLSLIHATLESTTDAIVSISTTGMITGYNQHFVKMVQAPSALLEKRVWLDVWETCVVPLLTNVTVETQRIEQIDIEVEKDSSDVLELKSGQIFERYSKPQQIDHKFVGRVWSFREVTEKRQAERQMETLHKQLLETSRQAGMAEVATSVLHNVGNVLNSVNVSASLVSSTMKESKSANLGKIVDMLNQHKQNLGEFLSQDPRGKQIFTYMEQLSRDLARERALTVEELSHLQNNVEHIKEIVMMQQSYAKLSGFVEKVSLKEMFEDALRMNGGALQRHGVEVVRNYDEVKPIDLEKNKILQILVNLIRNAKYACGEFRQTDKMITVKIVREDAIVKMLVQDNGIGIAPENLDRIFNHGFTTRKEGHGFGLHSSAIAAKEMGGSLNVFSSGVGMGATFTLTLPYPHS